MLRSCSHVRAAQRRQQRLARKRFFLKEEAKTFENWRKRCRNTPPQVSKVFWFFFSKRTLP